MKLRSLFDNFHFIETDQCGNSKIIWKKFFVTLIMLFIIIQIFLALIYSSLHIFPPTTVYEQTMDANDTRYYFNFGNNNNKESNNHLTNVYLNSKELNITNKIVKPTDENNNFYYYINIPKNVNKFTLNFYLDAEFPYIPQQIVFNVVKA